MKKAQPAPAVSEQFCPTLTEFSGTPINVGCFDTMMNVFKPLRPELIDAIYSLYRYVSFPHESKDDLLDAS